MICCQKGTLSGEVEGKLAHARSLKMGLVVYCVTLANEKICIFTNGCINSSALDFVAPDTKDS